MLFSLKDSESNWILTELEDVETGKFYELLIDYPTREQNQILERMYFDITGKKVETGDVKMKDGKVIEAEMKGYTVDLEKKLAHAREYIKFTVKGVRCETLIDVFDKEKNELNEKAFEKLTRFPEVAYYLFDLIKSHLEFTHLDKKK